MATAKITLTSTPVQVSTGASGVRIQSHHREFYWAASTTKPTDLSLGHTDKDVYIEDKGAIWAWTNSKEPLYVVVT